VSATSASGQQRIVIVMCDGLGSDYFALSRMPNLERWAARGIHATVRAVMPSVTNANNTSICCGAFPETHGVVGNSWLDARTGTEEYLESGDLVLAPTIFERAARLGIRSALFTSKRKTVNLLSRGTDFAVAAESPGDDWTARLGPAPPIYSREINHWLLRAAIEVLGKRPEIGLLYVHTTDFPMHEWPPAAGESQAHLAEIDRLLGEMEAIAPDAAFLVTADHAMNFKMRCWDLERALAARGVPLRAAISAERDKYLRHHRGFGGTAWIYLRAPDDADRVTTALGQLEGVEQVLSRAAAARAYRLMAARIGDLVVLGDRDTVFGHLDEQEMEALPPTYRSHGSLHELDVPLVLHNAHGAPAAHYFRRNLDLARWLYPR
jgi:phosphonoacetate hydrolase